MFNKLLTEQINKFIGAEENISPELISFLNEISETYDDFEKSNKELDQFAYIVSHDLKAPLRAISSLSTWLEEDLSNSMDEKSRENFAILKSRVMKMENLINGILKYSRSTKSTTIETVNTGSMVKEIILSLVCPHNISITQCGNFPVLQTERIKLEQVFSNLIVNAIKYNNKETGTIKISCIDFEDHCELSVEDNGVGIDKQYHQKIFNIFQTLEVQTNSENTGIGLAIVKKIVEDQKGKIWVESEPGKGSKFIFTWNKIKSNQLIENH